MEALRITSSQAPLLCPHRRYKLTPQTLPVSRRTPIKPFINAVFSKSAADVPPLPTSSPAIPSPTPSSTVSTDRKKVSPNSLRYPPGYLGAVPERTVQDGSNNIINAMEYLTNILSAKVYDVAIESPLQFAPKLSERLGVKVFLKREDLQPVKFFSFQFLFSSYICLSH